MPDTTQYNNPHAEMTSYEKYLRESMYNIVSQATDKGFSKEFDDMKNQTDEIVAKITNSVRIALKLKAELDSI